jgi:hypothetical protein
MNKITLKIILKISYHMVYLNLKEKLYFYLGVRILEFPPVKSEIVNYLDNQKKLIRKLNFY